MPRRNSIAAQHSCAVRSQLMILAALALATPLASGCRTSVNEPTGNIALNAPVAGIVRRVLVVEGASVDKDVAIIEIGVQPEHAGASQPSNTNSDQARAERAAQSNLASAEGEANRTSAELRRIEPLVKRGLASQAELDKARAQSQDAQERLKLARERAKNPDVNRNQPPAIASTEEIVAVRTPSAGTVRGINIRAGQIVTTGQQLATLVPNS